MPNRRNKNVIPIDIKNPGKYIGYAFPIIAHRNPSIIPTIGFNEYNSLHFSGIISLLKPTGETYNPNWTIKGTIYLKSLYFTFIAATNKPAPIENNTTQIKKRRRVMIVQEGI